MVKNDVVYILKEDVEPDELIYSLRSICKNFPHREVWVFGGCPDGICNVNYVRIVQTGANKWAKVTDTIRQVCMTEAVTDDFWLFNDDFFVMKPIGEFKPAIGGSLARRVQKVAALYNGKESMYARQLRLTAGALRDAGYDRLDYALHVPMLINKEKALLTIKKFGQYPMFRSLYGNHHEIGGEVIKDVKVQGKNEEPNRRARFLSTNDESFRKGIVGEYIRGKFPSKCKYEV